MKVLAIESSGLVAAVAVTDGERLVGEFMLNHRKTHSQQLMPLVEQLLQNLGMTPQDIDLFAVSQGPGSFTGLRIGISTIKGLAQALNKPVIGIPTLDGLAYNLAWSEGLICPIMDARREQVYTSIYRWYTPEGQQGGKGCLERLEEYMAIPVVELLEKLKAWGKPVIFNGDGVPVYQGIIEQKLGAQAGFAPATSLMQRASSIASLAIMKDQSGNIGSYFELTPFYLRKSQAERKIGK